MVASDMAPKQASKPASHEAPLVSVVVPCFNGGIYLDALMGCLERQTFRNFEIIIVDDGSTDPDTLRKLAELGTRARVIRQENGGPSAARNTGIAASAADVIFPLDCDDSVEPTFLEEAFAALHAASPEVGMVFADQRLVGAEAGVVPRYFNRFDLLFTNTIGQGPVMRKTSWQAAGGYDKSMRAGYEDWDFSLRLADAGFQGLRIPKPLYIYHIRNDDADDSRSSAIHASQMYGRLWKMIRERHAANYRLPALLRTWWTTRDGQGRIPLYVGLAGYLLALVLPDALFSILVGLRRRRMPNPEVAGEQRMFPGHGASARSAS